MQCLGVLGVVCGGVDVDGVLFSAPRTWSSADRRTIPSDADSLMVREVTLNGTSDVGVGTGRFWRHWR